MANFITQDRNQRDRRKFITTASTAMVTGFVTAGSLIGQEKKGRNDLPHFFFGDAPIQPVDIELKNRSVAGLPPTIRVDVCQQKGLAVIAHPFIPLSIEKNENEITVQIADVFQDNKLYSEISLAVATQLNADVKLADVPSRRLPLTLIEKAPDGPRELANAMLLRARRRVVHNIRFNEAMNPSAQYDIAVELPVFGKHSQTDLSASLSSLKKAYSRRINELIFRNPKTGTVSPIRKILLPTDKTRDQLKNTTATKTFVKAISKIDIQIRRGANPKFLENVLDRILGGLISNEAFQNLTITPLEAISESQEMVLAVDRHGIPWAAKLSVLNNTANSNIDKEDTLKDRYKQHSNSSSAGMNVEILGVVGLGGNAASSAARASRSVDRKAVERQISSSLSGHFPYVAIDVTDLASAIRETAASVQLKFGEFEFGEKLYPTFFAVETLPTFQEVKLESADRKQAAQLKSENRIEKAFLDVVNAQAVYGRLLNEYTKVCDKLKFFEIELQIIGATNGYLIHLKKIGAIKPEILSGFEADSRSRWTPYGSTIDQAIGDLKLKVKSYTDKRENLERQVPESREKTADALRKLKKLQLATT